MTRAVTVLNPTGFHARPARNFVDLATVDFPDTSVTLTKGPKVINGKSVLSMLTLGAKCGDEITIDAVGGDETKALKVLGDLFETIFKE